jgi:hypothetical protein
MQEREGWKKGENMNKSMYTSKGTKGEKSPSIASPHYGVDEIGNVEPGREEDIAKGKQYTERYTERKTNVHRNACLSKN